MQNVNPLLLIVVSLLAGSLLTGITTFMLFRRELDLLKGKVVMKIAHDENCPASHKVMSNEDHEAVCQMKTEPIYVKIEHLKESQNRVEKKVDGVDKKIDAVNTHVGKVSETLSDKIDKLTQTVLGLI